MTSDVAYTQDMFVEVLATLLPSLLLVVGMFVVMLALDPWFTLLALLATPPLVLATHRSRLRLRQASRAVRRADGIMASSATESLSSIQLIQAFTLEDDRSRRFQGFAAASLDAGLDAVPHRVAVRAARRRVRRGLDSRRGVVRGPTCARR